MLIRADLLEAFTESRIDEIIPTQYKSGYTDFYNKYCPGMLQMIQRVDPNCYKGKFQLLHINQHPLNQDGRINNLHKNNQVFDFE